MPTYRVVFENGRIGRDHDVGAATIRADGLEDLAEAVYAIARPHLMSSYPEVAIDQDEGDNTATGLIFAGFHTVGRFTVEEMAS